MILTVGTSLALSRVMVFDRVDAGGVNRARQVRISAAGKSINAARAAHAIGAEVVACGAAGGHTGRQLRDELDRAGIAHDLVETSRPTRVCVTAIDRAAGAATELIEEPGPLLPDELDQLWESLLQRVPQAKVAIASGVLAPNVPVGFYALLCRLARDAGVAAIIDAKGPELLAAVAERPTLVKPNLAELGASLGRPLPDESEVRAAMGELMDRGAGSVAVTAGAERVLFADRNGCWRLLPPKIVPVSAIGSGDSFAGGFATALEQGQSPIEAARFGVACGTANALTPAAGFIERSQVQRVLEQVQVTKLG